MGALSGTSGAIDGISTVMQWSVESKADLEAWVASNTLGMEVVSDGNDDWSGSYQAKGHTPAKMPGDAFTFSGSIDGAKGVSGTAIIDSIEVVANQETGETIGHTVTFSGNGALTLGASTSADATVPEEYSAKGRKVEIAAPAAAPTFAELTDVKKVTFKFTAANAAYVNSSTSGHTLRKKGPVSGELSIDANFSDPATLLVPNTVKSVRVYVTATTYWLFSWIKFGNLSNITTDIKTGAIVSATMGGKFTGMQVISDVATRGEITDPAAATWWPPA